MLSQSFATIEWIFAFGYNYHNFAHVLHRIDDSSAGYNYHNFAHMLHQIDELMIALLVTTTITLLMCCIELMIALLSSFLEKGIFQFDISKLVLAAASSVVSSAQLLELNRRAHMKKLVLLKFNAMCRTRTHVLSVCSSGSS
jgi:hypothetical protein